MLVTLAHEGADRRWRAVQDCDLQLFDDGPPAIPRRGVGGSLVHHLCRAVAERTINNVAVSGHPANVGGAPVDVVGLDIKDGAVREGCAEEVAGAGVHDPLRLRRGAAGVEQVEQLFGWHRVGRALSWLTWHELVPPVVTARLHRGSASGACLTTLIDEHTGDGWGVLECLVGDRLEFEEVPLAVAAVGGDQHLRGRVIDPIGERIRGEAAEDHAVRGTETGAGEHGDRHLGDHRHVDGDAVALRHAERLQRIGRLLNFAQKVVVGNGATVAWLADPVEGHPLAPASRNVPIDAVL